MNTKQLIPLVIVLAVTGLLAIVITSSRNRNVSEVGATTERNLVMPKFPINEVASVTIRAQSGSVRLEKKDGAWSVAERAGYPADRTKVGELLKTVFELAIVETPAVGASKLGRVGLLDPADDKAGEGETATVLAFTDAKGGDAGSLWIGKELKKEERSQFGTFDSTVGRYVKRGDAEAIHKVAQEFRDAKTEPKDWISKDFFRVTKVKTISRKTADAAESWTLTRESDTADFTLMDAKEGETIDPTKVSPMKNAFSSPSFEDVLTGGEVKKPEEVTFEVETFEGFRYTVRTGPKNEANEFDLTVEVTATFPTERKAAEGESEEDKKKKDEEFANEQKELKKKLEQEKRLAGHVYRVRGFVADSINKNRSELMKEPEKPADAAPGAGTPSGLPGLDSALPGLGAPTPGNP
jgi:hypothetical protein